MFLGSSFSGMGTAVSDTPVAHNSIVTLSLTNMIIDEMYASKNVYVHFDWEIPKDWDFQTYLHALFQGDAYAGNVTYSENVVQKVKIKKRYRGDFEWKTIHEKEIHSNADFSIELYDYYVPSNHDVEYAYVAVISNADADPISTSVHSEFEYYFLCGKDESYPLILDTSTSINLNRESNAIVSPGKKYPYVINNGIARYYSGTLKVTLIEMKDSDFDVQNGWQYRNKVDEFLSDGKPKILKSFQGDMWMVNVVGNLPRTTNGHYENVSHQIDWVECGDPKSIADLYDNDFIDTDIDRE